MKEFVEFNHNGDTIALRPVDVVLVKTAENGATDIKLDTCNTACDVQVTEPYAEVLKKLEENE